MIACCNGWVVIPRRRLIHPWTLVILVMASLCVVLLQVQPVIRIKETTSTTNIYNMRNIVNNNDYML